MPSWSAKFLDVVNPLIFNDRGRTYSVCCTRLKSFSRGLCGPYTPTEVATVKMSPSHLFIPTTMLSSSISCKNCASRPKALAFMSRMGDDAPGVSVVFMARLVAVCRGNCASSRPGSFVCSSFISRSGIWKIFLIATAVNGSKENTFECRYTLWKSSGLVTR